MAKPFEYIVIQHPARRTNVQALENLNDTLNEHGKASWELVAVVVAGGKGAEEILHYFKRPRREG